MFLKQGKLMRVSVAVLAALLLSVVCAPVFAEEEPQDAASSDGALSSGGWGAAPGPALQSEDAEEEEFWFFTWLAEASEDGPYGLYGPCGVPADTAELYLEFSFDGEDFERFESRSWGAADWAEDGFLPYQLLVGADESPLSDFLAEEQARLFIRMYAVADDGAERWTEAEEIVLDTEEEVSPPVLELELVEDGGAPGLYGALDGIPDGAVSMGLEYSFGGERYSFFDGFAWDFDRDPADPQLCISIDAHPLSSYLRGAANTLAVRLTISTGEGDLRTEPVVLTHGNTYPLPQTPPPFTAEVRFVAGGYQVDGHFTDFPPDVVRVRPMYSLDGATYRTVDGEYPNDWDLANLGAEGEGLRHDLENQTCVTYNEEPVKSYAAGRLDRFILRLEITTESGTFHSQAAVIERGAPQPVPDGTVVKAAFPYTMRPLDEIGNLMDVPYGQYRVTLRENATPETVRALLSDTLPVEVQFLRGDSDEKITSGVVQCPVSWKPLPPFEAAAGQSLTLPNAAGELTVPAGAEVVTPLGSYLLSEPLPFPGGEVRLVLDIVGSDEKPDVSLQINDYGNALDEIGALSLAFRQKPSGASKITAYSFVNGDVEWTELCDLLSHRRVDHNQAAELYGYVTVLRPDEAPFADYLRGELPGFCVGLAIEGGVFDGEKVILPWPGNYNPPDYIPEPGGSEGNENNAGADNGGGSYEDGRRPDLPRETDAPPAASTGNPKFPAGLPAPAAEAEESLTVPKRAPSSAAEPEGRPDAPSGPPEADRAIPAWNGSPLSDLSAGERASGDPQKSGGIPVTAAIVLACGGIAAALGVAGRAGVAKLLGGLRRFFSRR